MPESRNGRTRDIAGVLTLALLAVLFTPAHATAAATTTTRVSVTGDGTEANAANQGPVISSDGRFVAWTSGATNLVAGDTNGVADVFVKDRVTGAVSRASVASDGTEANASSQVTGISADGRYLVFQSFASNLVGGDTNNLRDVFVHDRQSGATARVSSDSNGTQANRESTDAAISADGRYVVFSSGATNLAVSDMPAGDSGQFGDVFVKDRQTGGLTRVSVATTPAGKVEGAGFSGGASISADGRYVAFASSASNLVSGDTDTQVDIYVHDRTDSSTVSISGTATSPSDFPNISDDGNVIAYQSGTNTVTNIFVHNRSTGTNTLASVSDQSAIGNGLSLGPVLDADGSRVTFISTATNLVIGDTNARPDVFRRDLETGKTERVSVAEDGSQADNNSGATDIDASGVHVVFQSSATNLVAGDTNGTSDIFVRGPALPTLPVVSVGEVRVHEGHAGTRGAVFTVGLSKASAKTVTVAYATADGTASQPGDYSARSGTLSFAPGVTSLPVKVPVIGDSSDEVDESFNVVLSGAEKAVIGGGTGQGTIIDDDPGTAKALAIGDVSVHEGDAGTRVAVFTVSLSSASAQSVTVNFATAAGSASKATDFVGKNGTLSFAPGATSATAKIVVVGDTAREGNEVFTVNLSGSSGPVITDATGVGTILDND